MRLAAAYAGSLATLLLLTSPAAGAGWFATPIGPVVAGPPSSRDDSHLAIADGSGGVIVQSDYYDYASNTGRIALRRIDADGTFDSSWNGVFRDQATRMCADGMGGIFEVHKTSLTSMIVERLNLDGTPVSGWPFGGVTLLTDLSVWAGSPVADGSGGVIVIWGTGRKALDMSVMAQHVTASGERDPTWGSGGRLVFATAYYSPEEHESIMTCGDGAGGAYVAWNTFTRPGPGPAYYPEVYDTYINHILADGSIDPSFGADGRQLPAANGTRPIGLVAVSTGGYVLGWSGSGFHQTYVGPDGVERASTPLGLIDLPAVLPLWTADADGSAFYVGPPSGQGLNTGPRVYRIMPEGSPMPGWPEAGAVIADAAYFFAHGITVLALAADHEGGAFVFWREGEYDGTSRLKVQHLSAQGELDPAWPAAGQLVTPGNHASLSGVVTSAPGEVTALWPSEMYGSVNAQRISVHPDPDVAARLAVAADVPGDQGGHVHVTWLASPLQSAPWSDVLAYRVWRKPGAGSPGAGADWELVTPVEPNAAAYDVQVPSYADSSPGGIAEVMIRIEAVDAGGFSLGSRELSASSTDDLAPATPVGLIGNLQPNGTLLIWSANHEADLVGYRIFRGSTPDFPLTQQTFVRFTTATLMFDASPGGYYYRIVAEDVHGNRSTPATLQPDGTLDAPAASAHALAFSLPTPSPARTRTQFRFALPVAGQVDLEVFDPAGRVVARPASSVFAAGEHAVEWDLRDDARRTLPAGVYMVRLTTARGSRQQRIVLIP